MTTHWNPAHADEEPEAAGNQESGDPGRNPAPASRRDQRSDDRSWNGYVVPDPERTDAGWAPPAGDAWPASRPVGPPASSYPALRRAVDQQSGGAAPEGGADDDPAEPAVPGGPVDAAEPAAPTAGGAPDTPVPQAEPQPPQAAADPDPGAAGAAGFQSRGGHRTGADETGGPGGAADPDAPEPLPKRSPRKDRRESPHPGAAGPAERPSHGRHAAARGQSTGQDAGADGGDPDDPDHLADWVGSLTTVNESNMIAGRRTGPMPIVKPITDTGAGPADTGGADAAGGEAEPEAGTAPARPGQRSAGPIAGARYWADDDPGDLPGGDQGEYTADGEYVPTSGGEQWEPMPEVTREQLIERLDAVSALVGIGADDFDADLIERAQYMLDHAGARLRLSGEHTVVALAGGTGSGKSSLFNALCGLDFSRVGITRPTTSDAHACVWGNEGAEGLLGWIGVPRRNRHSRTSELDKSNSELSGLILLDLPDHDSVRSEHTAEADRLIGSCDLLVWVLDPQKYADAAVHHRYLAEMAGYGAVTVAVLNQVDRVAPDELEELLTDLRRLLETESGAQPRVLTTSTLTGQGIGGLRSLLAETVSQRRALIDRLVADLDRVVVGFERYHGDPGQVRTGVPDRARSALVADLVEAGGVAAIADTAETAYEQRGERRVGWPPLRWAAKLRPDPLSKVGDGFADAGGRPAPIEAYGAGIDKAAVDVADQVAGSLPAPWPRRVRAAARSGLDLLPGELSEAVAASVPDPDDTPGWWRGVQAVQYLLVVLAGAGVVWFAGVLASWLAGGFTGMAVLDDPVFLGVAAAVAVATPVTGWLVGTGCANLIGVAAGQRREQVQQRSSQRARELAEQRILAPVEQELARYAESCSALARAQGKKAD
ncbi:hypothetical protein GCM10027570_32210 [Streptomonospora sediminis]